MPWPISSYQGPFSAEISMPASLKVELGLMRARLVAARDERDPFVLECLERGDDILRSLDASRIALRSDQDEVVVHHRVALHAKTFRQEFLLRRFGVDEHNVCVSAAPGIERLAGSLRDDFHIDPSFGFEQRQDM